MAPQVMEQTRVDLAEVIAEGKKRHFYFKEVNKNTYKGNWTFTPIEYFNLNHDERKRVAVLDLCGVPVKGFLRGEEVVEVQQIVLPRIHLPWKIIAGAAGAVLAAVLLAPILIAIATAGVVLLMASLVVLVDPVTIAVIDENGTEEGQWLELMFSFNSPALSFTWSEKR